MASIFTLPSGILLMVFGHLANLAQASNVTGTTTSTFTSVTTKPSRVVCATISFSSNTTLPIAPTGTGSEYASSCSSLSTSYASVTSSVLSKYAFTDTTTYTLGGTLVSAITSYLNASTLCDGYPRVNYSPAIPISTRTTTVIQRPTQTATYTENGSCFYRPAGPVCSIKPDDCDGLWSAYSTSIGNMPPYPTLMPQRPPCINSSQSALGAAISSEIYGCGPCTMYGQGVQLIYFPPPATATRDMCASTPSASLTHYGPGAVITAYTGTDYHNDSPNTGQVTAVVDGHTFTSGTAYISIATVYAKKRCTTDPGFSVYDAVLAMPSQSVLSLRYSQDHFQHFMQTDQQTGYPLSYADFATPIPWSAWNGQSRCQGAGDFFRCGVIYENEFRPQLAIPPGIRDLHTSFEGCQLWYGGLYDPPLALTQQESAASATLPTYITAIPTATSTPNGGTAPASPSSVATVPTATATAIADNLPPQGGGSPNGGSGSNGGSSSDNGGNSGKGSGNGGDGSNTGNTPSNGGAQTGAGVTNTPQSTGGNPGSTAPKTFVVTVDGQTRTATQSSPGGPIYISTFTLTPGGAATTLADGKSISAASNGLVVDRTTFVSTGAVTTDSPFKNEGSGGMTATTTSAAAAAAAKPHDTHLMVIGISAIVLSFLLA